MLEAHDVTRFRLSSQYHFRKLHLTRRTTTREAPLVEINLEPAKARLTTGSSGKFWPLHAGLTRSRTQDIHRRGHAIISWQLSNAGRPHVGRVLVQ
jgi:hypothetical protein